MRFSLNQESISEVENKCRLLPYFIKPQIHSYLLRLSHVRVLFEISQPVLTLLHDSQPVSTLLIPTFIMLVLFSTGRNQNLRLLRKTIETWFLVKSGLRQLILSVKNWLVFTGVSELLVLVFTS